MSATPSHAVEQTIECCRPTDATPVTIDADSLESTAKPHLRTVKSELAANGLVPAELHVDACFDEDCSLATQDEIDRVRDLVFAAAFLGVSTVTLSYDAVADPDIVTPALDACAERAEREGVTLELAD
ncbi:hypothetical protein [Halocalculus aciditolerans]|uniref:DUF7961 domain-containing protein n=1 Tax=Halocalculus aciditolerans TaxID=1383812 RepID=A0A830FAZ8_9EURY|nr:hypothetical protein [Halocalculus aciditolerans]GGL57108.1 hypothetical protein GCM10009039_14110 [Halocalculus aciditolerans]